MNLKKFINDALIVFCDSGGGHPGVVHFACARCCSTRNAFIPAYALIAIVFAAALQYLQENVTERLSGNFKLAGSVVLLAFALRNFHCYNIRLKTTPHSARFQRRQCANCLLENSDGEFFNSNPKLSGAICG